MQPTAAVLEREGDKLHVTTTVFDGAGEGKNIVSQMSGAIVGSELEPNGESILKVRFDGEAVRQDAQRTMNSALDAAGKVKGTSLAVPVVGVESNATYTFKPDGTVALKGDSTIVRGDIEMDGTKYPVVNAVMRKTMTGTTTGVMSPVE